MAIVTITDLKTVMYAEIINEITRGDDTIVQEQINSAIDECKGYLSRYDRLKLFGDDTANPVIPATPPVPPLLLTFVKDIAMWRIICLGNPNMLYEHVRTLYQDTISRLKDIQKGTFMPDGWPYLDTTGQTAEKGNSVSWHSARKRENRF